MLAMWIQDLESLEAISQNDSARRIFLKMAAMSQAGTMGSLLNELEDGDEVGDHTKGMVTELAHDRAFLLAVEDYLRRTQVVH